MPWFTLVKSDEESVKGSAYNVNDKWQIVNLAHLTLHYIIVTPTLKSANREQWKINYKTA